MILVAVGDESSNDYASFIWLAIIANQQSNFVLLHNLYERIDLFAVIFICAPVGSKEAHMPHVNWRVGSGLMCNNEVPSGLNSLVARGSLSDMVFLAVQTDALPHDQLFILLEGDGERISWQEICLMYEQPDFPQII